LVTVVDYKVDRYLNLRLGEETKGLQVEYHRMGRSHGGSPRLCRLWTVSC
jgi:hypothetical protein